MKKLLVNNALLVALSIFLVCTGFVIGYIKQDFYWFSRFGALVVGLGIVLLSRTAFTGRDLLLDVTSADTQVNLNAPEHFEKLGESIPEYVVTDISARKAINILGPVITLTGTVIWGFGDLLNYCFCFVAK